MIPNYVTFIKSADDLVTPLSKVFDGFVRQAGDKARVATPRVETAKEFWEFLNSEKIQSIADVVALLNDDESRVRYGRLLQAAAGYSQKAINNISKFLGGRHTDDYLKEFYTERIKRSAGDAVLNAAGVQNLDDIERLITSRSGRKQLLQLAAKASKTSQKAIAAKHRALAEAELVDELKKHFASYKNNPNFRQELFLRYMLTEGDSLGGTMRNLIGRQGKRELVKHIVHVIREQELEFKIYLAGDPIVFDQDDVEEPETRRDAVEEDEGSKEPKTSAVAWQRGTAKRLVVFDATPPKHISSNNVDVILLDAASLTGNVLNMSAPGLEEARASLLSNVNHYLACGELKAGIDPGGADEHWKTAKTAMGRLDEIRSKKSNAVMDLFLVVAAVETTMAGQIFRALEEGELHHAANLTSEEQVQDLARWLIER